METSRGSFRVRRRTLKSVSKPPFRLATRLQFPATPAPAAAFVICCCSGTTVPEALLSPPPLFSSILSDPFLTLLFFSSTSRGRLDSDLQIFRSSDHGQTIKRKSPTKKKKSATRFCSCRSLSFIVPPLPSPIRICPCESTAPGKGQ
ncbi:hypothetical protein BJX62DRAFT_213149 [Aspergillus germanicus]